MLDHFQLGRQQIQMQLLRRSRQDEFTTNLPQGELAEEGCGCSACSKKKKKKKKLIPEENA
jgi:hypothetical protein